MLRNFNPLQKVNLFIHSAIVRGNIYTDPANRPLLTTISENCVRRQDTAVIQMARKTFTGQLTVDHFNSVIGPTNYAELIGLQRDQLFTAGRKIVFKCIKQFQQLTVIGKIQVTSDLFGVEILNGFNLMDGMQNMAHRNETISLDEVIFASNVNMASVSVEIVDQTPFALVLEQLESVVGERGIIGSVRINGDVSFMGSLRVRKVNDIALDEYLGLVVSKESRGIVISGTKRFLDGITVGQLQLQHLNNWNVAELVTNALHKNRTQTIPSIWTIGRVQAQQLWAPSINNVLVDQLIDASDENIEIESDVVLQSLNVDSNIIAEQTNCDFGAVLQAINTGLRKTQWHSIVINGQANWPPSGFNTPINRLFGFAVTSFFDQNITGDITFAAPTQIHQFTLFGTVNSVNVPALAGDALVSTSMGFQVIAGDKVFHSRLVTGPLMAHGDLSIPIINGCDLVDMTRTMFRTGIDRELTGAKVFRVAPAIINLHVAGPINGIAITDIVTVKSSQPIPPVSFWSDIHVNSNLNIVENLNYVNFAFFLENRLRQHGSVQEVRGALTFENLSIKGLNSRVVTINEIPIEDAVLVQSDAEQVIEGRKRMVGTLSLEGPVVVTEVNGVDLVDAFLHTVRLDTNMAIQQLTVLNNITLQRGMVVREKLNGADVMAVQYWQPPSVEDMKPMQREILTEINRAERTLRQSQSNTSNVYLDYAADVKIRYVNQSDAETFIVDTWTPCDQCQCPLQNFVSITKFQVNIFRRPLFQRVIRLQGLLVNFTILTTFEESKTCFGNPITTKPNASTVLQWTFPDRNHPQNSMVIYPSSAIRDAKLFEQDLTTLLLVHQLDQTVTVLQLDPENRFHWIVLDRFANGQPINHMHVLSWDNYRILLVMRSAAPKSAHGTAQMYYFNGLAFTPLYGTIAGDFDQCAWVHQRRRGEFMVWLGRTGSDVITVFKAISRGGILRRFGMLQSIVVQDATVKKLVPLQVQGKYCSW